MDTKKIIKGSAIPFSYKRPRCPLAHLWRAIKRTLRKHSRRIAQIIAQSAVSGSFIGGGILILPHPIGILVTFGGILLVLTTLFGEPVESHEEYRQAVIEHFRERGQTPPRWTRQEVSDV